MGTLVIPLLPLAERQEIVRPVASLFALADQLDARLASAPRQVDALTPSRLARSFAGNLVQAGLIMQSESRLFWAMPARNSTHALTPEPGKRLSRPRR